MKPAFKLWGTGATLVIAALNVSIAQTKITGLIVDEKGAPISKVACCTIGYPRPDGGRDYYDGLPPDPIYSDEAGAFTIPNRRGDMLDLGFDHWAYAPTFLYDLSPGASAVRVVMKKGKMLKGRVLDEQGKPMQALEIQLRMTKEETGGVRRRYTDRNGRFLFRISEPPKAHTWIVSLAGKQFKVDYDQVTPDKFLDLQVNVQMALKSDPGGPQLSEWEVQNLALHFAKSRLETAEHLVMKPYAFVRTVFGPEPGQWHVTYSHEMAEWSADAITVRIDDTTGEAAYAGPIPAPKIQTQERPR
jgi:hypothetical protein